MHCNVSSCTDAIWNNPAGPSWQKNCSDPTRNASQACRRTCGERILYIEANRGLAEAAACNYVATGADNSETRRDCGLCATSPLPPLPPQAPPALPPLPPQAPPTPPLSPPPLCDATEVDPPLKQCTYSTSECSGEGNCTTLPASSFKLDYASSLTNGAGFGLARTECSEDRPENAPIYSCAGDSIHVEYYNNSSDCKTSVTTECDTADAASPSDCHVPFELGKCAQIRPGTYEMFTGSCPFKQSWVFTPSPSETFHMGGLDRCLPPDDYSGG